MGLLSALALLLAAQSSTTFHVTPDGRDARSGRLPSPNKVKTDGPFAGPGRVRDAIRERRAAGSPSGAVPVLIRQGVRALPDTLLFEAQDSGTAEAPAARTVTGARISLRACGAQRPL